MKKRLVIWTSLGVVAVAWAAGAIWMHSLPPAPTVGLAPEISQQEADATVAALKPPRRLRPLIAILGINEGTEMTDYMMPFGILRRADVADVMALSTGAGPVTLYPAALKVMPQATIAQFDVRYPDGADYVIVPAMSRNDDAAALQWIKRQSKKGALIIGVCVGVRVVANAGLLDGKKGTTHWFYVEKLREQHPKIEYVANRRFVVDGNVATTTGISASMPMSLTLIEAIAGRDKAQEVARQLGLAHWDARHNSEEFKFTRPFAATAVGNKLAVWSHEKLGMEIAPGVDEVSLALVADAWSRTFKSQAVTFARTAGEQTSRNGLVMVPDQVTASWPAERLLPSIGNEPPADALRGFLRDIATRQGEPTADIVAMQLEYPKKN